MGCLLIASVGKTLVDTVVFHIDAMTGADVRSQVVKRSRDGRVLLQGLDVIPGAMLDAFMLHNETRAVVMLDEFLQVSIYAHVKMDEKKTNGCHSRSISTPRTKKHNLCLCASRNPCPYL